jgi:RNase P subunit RPR2
MRLRRDQVLRLGRLLNMHYRPSELAAEIGCHPDTVYRSYLPAGCPHQRDGRGHIWIVGTEFAEWARALSAKGQTKLADGEAYCLKCNAPVEMAGTITVRPTNRYLELMTAQCPHCGSTVNRARARRDTDTETEGDPK